MKFASVITISAIVTGAFGRRRAAGHCDQNARVMSGIRGCDFNPVKESGELRDNRRGDHGRCNQMIGVLLQA
jgi:hypothetical protein